MKMTAKSQMIIIFGTLLMSLSPVNAEYFQTTLNHKKVIFWFDKNFKTGSFYFHNESPIYLLKLINEEKKIFQVFGEPKLIKTMSEIKLEISDNNKLKLPMISWKDHKNKLTLKKIKSLVEEIDITRKKYETDKCEFDFIQIEDLVDMRLIKRAQIQVSKMMEHYVAYGCSYLNNDLIQNDKIKKAESANGAGVEKNKLSCDVEIVYLNKRFIGTNFYCSGQLASQNKINDKPDESSFVEIYDLDSNSIIKREDLTYSDLKTVDDLQGAEFGISTKGLFYYYPEKSLANISDYKRFLPYHMLKTHFSNWGKPRKLVKFFEKH